MRGFAGPIQVQESNLGKLPSIGAWGRRRGL
jgi:hypothetical protein